MVNWTKMIQILSYSLLNFLYYLLTNSNLLIKILNPLKINVWLNFFTGFLTYLLFFLQCCVLLAAFPEFLPPDDQLNIQCRGWCLCPNVCMWLFSFSHCCVWLLGIWTSCKYLFFSLLSSTRFYFNSVLLLDIIIE